MNFALDLLPSTNDGNREKKGDCLPDKGRVAFRRGGLSLSGLGGARPSPSATATELTRCRQGGSGRGLGAENLAADKRAAVAETVLESGPPQTRADKGAAAMQPAHTVGTSPI